MAVFPIHLLIVISLRGILNLCYGQAACSEDDLKTLKFYALPTNNRIDCRRAFHGDGATYTWTRIDYDQSEYAPIPANQNVTIINDGSGLLFDLTPSNKAFRCDIQRPDNRTTGPILYNIIKTRMTPINQGIILSQYNVSEYSFLSIPCTIMGTFVGSDIEFVWYKTHGGHKKMVEKSNRIYVDKRNNLNLSPVLKNDSALRGSHIRYHCEVKSPRLDVTLRGYDVLVHVFDAAPDHITTIPFLHYKSADVEAHVNDSLTLECVFSNDDQNGLVYKWYQPVIEGVGAGPNSFQARQHVLSITRLELRHEGFWYCGADNTQFYSIRHQISVKVVC